MVLSGWVGRGW